jgi:magnesium chelatase accessory protein
VVSERLVWESDGRDWPNRAASRFVNAGGLRWHVQVMGDGPVLLLLHGTGASTHSWRAFAPLLARRFKVVAPDLPGQGFTESPAARDMSIGGMARLIGALLTALDVEPRYVAGHSAGAAILCRMCLDGAIRPDFLFSLNGALVPYGGGGGQIFSSLAKLIFLNPLISAPRLFSWIATDRSAVERTLRAAGSHIDRQGVDFYARLFRNREHVAATLSMMAHWDLAALGRDLPRLKSRLVLIATEDDRAIPARDAFAIRDIVPGSAVVMLRRGGHLLHEERPDEVANILVKTIETDQTASAPPSASEIGGVG